MTARPLQLNALPRTASSAGGIAANGPSVALVRRRAVPLKMSPLGGGSLRCVDVTAALPPEDSDAIWGLSRPDDGRVGFLVLDGMTALRLLAATLGAPAPRVFRPLGISERGIVSAVIAAALRALRSELTVSLGPKSWTEAGLVRIIILAEFHNMRERLRLDVPTTWLPRPSSGDSSWSVEATRRGLEIPMSLQLARTTLTALDWSRARPGDAVVFDGAPAVDIARGWPAKLVCGGYNAEMVVGPDGSVTMESPFQAFDLPPVTGSSPPIATAENETNVNQGATMSEDSDLSQTMLAGAPIQVIAEIGRLAMRADEVAALRSGTVLPIGPLSPRIVTLRVGERMWAEGELVDVDGQLGVRLTSMSLPLEARARQTDDEDTLR